MYSKWKHFLSRKQKMWTVLVKLETHVSCCVIFQSIGFQMLLVCQTHHKILYVEGKKFPFNSNLPVMLRYFAIFVSVDVCVVHLWIRFWLKYLQINVRSFNQNNKIVWFSRLQDFFFNAMSFICESQVKGHKQTKDDPRDCLKIQ